MGEVAIWVGGDSVGRFMKGLDYAQRVAIKSLLHCLFFGWSLFGLIILQFLLCVFVIFDALLLGIMYALTIVTQSIIPIATA